MNKILESNALLYIIFPKTYMPNIKQFSQASVDLSCVDTNILLHGLERQIRGFLGRIPLAEFLVFRMFEGLQI